MTLKSFEIIFYTRNKLDEFLTSSFALDLPLIIYFSHLDKKIFTIIINLT